MIWWIIGLLILIALVFIVYYNRFVTLENRIDNSLSQIDVQLKKRADLVPNLISAVKGYAKHEKGLFEKVTELRSQLMKAQGPEEKAQANNMLTGALKSLFAVAENYPTLRASENFKELQEELSDTENKIAYSRQFYNSNVLNYNTKLEIFPNVIFARLLNFKPAEFFAASDEEKKDIKVNF